MSLKKPDPYDLTPTFGDLAACSGRRQGASSAGAGGGEGMIALLCSSGTDLVENGVSGSATFREARGF